MDLLERAAALAACPLLGELAPAVLIRLAERARASELAAGERRTTEDTVWIVARGRVRAGDATAEAGQAIGVIRVVRPQAAVVELIAEEACAVVALAADDVRDVLEEDPTASAALADRLAALLLGAAP
jgi:CRP-like cAMP-binding protein